MAQGIVGAGLRWILFYQSEQLFSCASTRTPNVKKRVGKRQEVTNAESPVVSKQAINRSGR